MGPTRKRDLTAAVVGVAILAYLLVHVLYRYFPPITVWTGLSLLAVAAIEAAWAVSVRAKIRDGEIGVGGGRLHPLAVARSVVIAKASAWVGRADAGLVDRRAGLPAAPPVRAAGGRRGHPGRRSSPRSAPWRWWSRRCGCSIAASRPASRPTTRRRRRRVRSRASTANRRSSTTRGRTSRGYSQPMTVLSRGARNRRGGRRPGWLLLTVLLVLAIAASSALVFTNRVELLKLAVILSLWAAVDRGVRLGASTAGKATSTPPGRAT